MSTNHHCDPLGGLSTAGLVSPEYVRKQVSKYIYGTSTDHAGLHAICDLLMLMSARLEALEGQQTNSNTPENGNFLLLE